MMKGYKAVRDIEHFDGKHTLSSFMWPNPSGCVGYAVGKVTYRKSGCGPLAVFKNLQCAKAFLKKESFVGHRLYSCEYEPSADRRVWNAHSSRDEFPVGTKLADSVELLEEVICTATRS